VANIILTALIGRVGKGCGDFRIHGNHRLPLKRHLRIAILDPLVDPVDEALAQNTAEAVDRVLPRPLQYLLDRWEEFADFLIPLGELQHLVDLEGLVQGHGDLLYALAVNNLDNALNNEYGY